MQTTDEVMTLDKSVNTLEDIFANRPSWWFDSKLAAFMEGAHVNLVRNFALRPEFESLEGLNQLFLYLREHHESRVEADYPFFIRSYSFWLSAVRAWASEQVTEVYALLRCSIECALYGNTLVKHDADPTYKELYVNRKQPNGRIKKDFHDLFGVTIMINELPSCNELARKLYDSTIELGAHPNLFGVFHSRDNGEGNREHIRYIGANERDLIPSKTAT